MAACINLTCGRTTVTNQRLFRYKILNVLKKCQNGCSNLSANTENLDVGELQKKPVIVPKKKKRDSLTVLKILANQVEKDPTRIFTYPLIDDPEFYPHVRYMHDRFLTMAEHGRLAAREIINKYPECFQDDPAAPHIPKYMPGSLKYQYSDEASLEALKERIKRGIVRDAALVEEKLKAEGVEIPLEIHLDLLDLYCVNNGQDIEPSQWLKYYIGNSKDEETTKWQEFGPAEILFDSFTDPPARAYRSLILGMSKFGGKKCLRLYRDMLSKKMPMDIAIFNAVLKYIIATKDKDAENLMIEICKDMKNQNVCPDINTMHCLMTVFDEDSVLCEMRALEIVPDLKTWGTYYLEKSKDLNFSESRNLSYDVSMYKLEDNFYGFLDALMTTIQETHPKCRNPKDVAIFIDAMRRIKFSAVPGSQKLQLANKIDSVFNQSSFPYFLKPNNPYYGAYFSIMLDEGTLAESVALFHRFAEQQVYFDLLEALMNRIQEEGAYQYIGEIWQVAKFVQDSHKRKCFLIFLNIMAKAKKQPPETFKVYDTIIHQMYKFAEQENKRRNTHGPCLVRQSFFNIIQIYIVEDAVEDAWKAFQMLKLNSRSDYAIRNYEYGIFSKLFSLLLHKKEPENKLLEVIQLVEQFSSNFANILRSEWNKSDPRKARVKKISV